MKVIANKKFYNKKITITTDVYYIECSFYDCKVLVDDGRAINCFFYESEVDIADFTYCQPEDMVGCELYYCIVNDSVVRHMKLTVNN